MSIFDTVLSPRITTMIRLDHTHVLAAFHRYSADTAPSRKAAIVNAACGALEIHAKLEEEIFYPALKKIQPTETALDKSVPEHDEMRATIAELRGMSADSPRFDELFMKGGFKGEAQQRVNERKLKLSKQLRAYVRTPRMANEMHA